MALKSHEAGREAEPRKTFGQFLSNIIEAKGIKQRVLADQVGITPAYLSRIKNDFKRPSVETARRIVTALALPEEGEEAQQLHEALGDDWPRDYEESGPNANELVENILTKVARRIGNDPGSSTRLAPLAEAELTNIPPIIVGANEMLEVMIRMLRIAAGRSPSNTPIYLKLGGIIEMRKNLSAGLWDTWLDALRLVLQKGWNIERLWILNREDRTTIPSLVGDLLDLLGYKGQYHPRYIYSSRVRFLPWAQLDLLVVPGMAGLTLTRTEGLSYPDTGFFFQTKAAMSEIERQIDFQLGNTSDLLTVYTHPKTGNLPFDTALTEAEEQGGDRRLFKDGVSVLHVPLDVVWGRARRIAHQEVDQQTVDELVINRKRRLEGFTKHIGNYMFRDICPKTALELLVKRGTRPVDAFLEGEGGRQKSFTLRERQQVLEMLLKHLEEPNYELALIKLDARSSEFLNRAFWEVIWNSETQSGNVLIETFPLRTERKAKSAREEYDLIIEEQSVVQAFTAYFDDHLWNKIPEKDRNKDKVRRYLEGRLKWLQKEIDAEASVNSQTE